MRLGCDSMVLLSSDVPSRSSIAMDCTSVAAAMVPHPMKQRGEPAGGNAVHTVSGLSSGVAGVAAPPSSWHHHKHEQLMLMEKQKTQGKTDVFTSLVVLPGLWFLYTCVNEQVPSCYENF